MAPRKNAKFGPSTGRRCATYRHCPPRCYRAVSIRVEDQRQIRQNWANLVKGQINLLAQPSIKYALLPLCMTFHFREFKKFMLCMWDRAAFSRVSLGLGWLEMAGKAKRSDAYFNGLLNCEF